MKNDIELSVRPLVDVDGIRFGTSRNEVRTILGNGYREFRKSAFSVNTTDDYGRFHVFYDCENRFEAIEIFSPVTVKLNGCKIFPIPLSEAVKEVPSLTKGEGDSLISKTCSIGLYVLDGEPESILFARGGYYK